jgi:transcriptional regulator with XRE-family HTH domain
MTNNSEIKTFLQHIGDKLRLARHLKDEKLMTVAHSTGISHTVLSQVENGRYYCLSLSMLMRILSYYHLEYKDICL